MKEFFDALARLVPFLQQYPVWVRILFCLLLLTLVIFIAALLFAKRGTPSDQSVGSESLAPVGDREIDAAQMQLEALLTESGDSDIVSALRYLFYRNLYRHIREEEPETALFAFCRTEYLLSIYQPRLRSADARDAIGHARTRLVKLQQHVGSLYGPSFSPHEHCHRHGVSRPVFVAKLPPRVGNPLDRQYIDAANGILAELRDVLKKPGIM